MQFNVTQILWCSYYSRRPSSVVGGKAAQWLGRRSFAGGLPLSTPYL